MTEGAQILALIAALLVAASLAIWSNWLSGPMLQRLDGRRASNVSPAALAIKLLVAALGVSAVAAVLAMAGWIFR